MHTVLITGAGSGIGQGLALRAATAGWNVLATDAKLQGARETARLIDADLFKRGSENHCEAEQLDVCDDRDVERVVNNGLGPQVDVLINNAGLQYVSKLENFPQRQWDQLLQVMVSGAARATRAVLPAMRQRGFGRIINIGSIHSLVASPYKSAYVAAKHGLLGLAKVVALETADCDITINTICPSYVRTPLVEQQIAAQAREHGMSEADVVDQIMLAPMPKRAFISIDELYGIAEFLCSDAARNITGQTITVDGGWTVR